MSPRLLCVYQHAPTPGAPGIYRHRLYLSELVRRGWHVDLISSPINYMTGEAHDRYARRGYTREVIDGIAHHWVWAFPAIHASRRHRALNYATFAAAALLRGVTLGRPDLVWASSPPLSVGTVGAVLATCLRCPWIFEVRDLWPESAAAVGWLGEGRLYQVLDRMARRYASRADGVIVPTPGLAAPVRAHGAREVHVVPGAVRDTAAGPRERRHVREEIGAGAETCVFVYVGALGVANGLDLLLDAVALLPANDRGRFLIVGDGSDRRRLEERIAREGLDRIHLRQAVPKGDVPAILAAGDVCLHLLRPDAIFATALPSKVLEYFGARRAFITTVPGLPERLALESGGGFACTAEALADELRRWAGMTPAERRARGERAFEYGLASFGLEATVDRLEWILARVRAPRG